MALGQEPLRVLSGVMGNPRATQGKGVEAEAGAPQSNDPPHPHPWVLSFEDLGQNIQFSYIMN